MILGFLDQNSLRYKAILTDSAKLLSLGKAPDFIETGWKLKLVVGDTWR